MAGQPAGGCRPGRWRRRRAGFVPEAEQAEILAGVLAGIELGAWDRRIAGLAGGVGCQHGADCRVVDRAGAGGRAGTVNAMIVRPGVRAAAGGHSW